MIRLRLSRRWLRITGIGFGLIAFVLACYFIGHDLTPRDARDRPVLLSPSIRAAVLYRKAVTGWTDTLAELDAGIASLLNQDYVADPAQLYALSEQAQGLSDRAVSVALDVSFTAPPPALVSLAEQANAAADAQYQAALAAAQWVGAPEPDNRIAALESLRLARAARTELAASRWLIGEAGR